MKLFFFIQLCLIWNFVICSQHALDTRVSNIDLSRIWWLRNSVVSDESKQHLFMNYMTDTQPEALVHTLKNTIVKLHKDSNNVKDPESYNLIIGSGGVQMINAAAYAMHKKFNHTRTNFSARIPHYNHFKLVAKYTDGMHWLDSPGKDCIEWITYPNNPDGKLFSAKFQMQTDKQIYDTVYYWPSYSSNIKPLDRNLMIFSLSKLSGHASTRLGWAFVKDMQIAKHMQTYIWLQTTHASVESMLFGLNIITTIVESKSAYYDFMYGQLTQRWHTINDMALNTDLIRILSKPSFPCLWVQCMRKNIPCHTQLESFGIISEPGSVFGSNMEYTRICMGMSKSSFDMFVSRLDSFLKQSNPQHWKCTNCPHHFVT